jgi:hypothetical protein
MSQSHAAQDHRCRVQAEGAHKQQVIDPVILPKTTPPQENRIDHAQAVTDHGEHEEMSIQVLAGEPRHAGQYKG